jgi:hypothetical protein
LDYPNLRILTSERGILPSGLEIDIFLPDLNLCIELNGPMHYFPIHGQEKLTNIKNKDLIKQIEIQNLGYRLIIIDISLSKNKNQVQATVNSHYENIKDIINSIC